MTDFASTALPPGHHGKRNMATEAFEALREARAKGEASGPGAGTMSFGDLLDTVNPLQHIPVISSLYREITGDTISPQARAAGGALYGGPIGLIASVFNAAVEAVSGADLGAHVIAGLTGDRPEEPAVTAGAAPKEKASTAEKTAVADEKPEAGPVRLASAERDGRLPANPRVSAASPTSDRSVPGPMPQLSPEVFDALLNSFSDPRAAREANPALAVPAESGDKARTASTAMPSNDLAGSMMRNLEQLDALKRAGGAEPR